MNSFLQGRIKLVYDYLYSTLFILNTFILKRTDFLAKAVNLNLEKFKPQQAGELDIFLVRVKVWSLLGEIITQRLKSVFFKACLCLSVYVHTYQ